MVATGRFDNLAGSKIGRTKCTRRASASEDERQLSTLI